MVSITEANQNFSKAARQVDELAKWKLAVADGGLEYEAMLKWVLEHQE